MRRFAWNEQRAAIRWAAAGGQALHVHCFGVSPSSPAIFRYAARQRKNIAHLFDWNAARLDETARGLGVVRLHIDRPGTAAMHADLCGRPLEGAMDCSYELREDALEVPHAFTVAAGNLWYWLKAVRPFTVHKGSEADRWPWAGPKGTHHDHRRGTAWFRERWTKAPDKSRLPDQLFDAITRAASHRAVLIVNDTINGLMFNTAAEAEAGYAAGIAVMGTAALRELLGQWLEFPQVMNSREHRCDDAATFAARHRERFTRDPDASDFRMAFGREQLEAS